MNFLFIKKIFLFIALCAISFIIANPIFTYAKNTAMQTSDVATTSAPVTQPDEYYHAHVTRIVSETSGTEPTQIIQTVEVEFTDGHERGARRTITYGDTLNLTDAQKLHMGDDVVVIKTYGPDGPLYYVQDHDRQQALLLFTIIFFGAVIVIARWKGLMSLVGLFITMAVLLWFLVPLVIRGYNPLVISVAAAFLIALSSIYIAHGFTTRTTLAVIATTGTLLISVGVAAAAVWTAQLFGTGSEAAMYIQFDTTHGIDLRGLLLGGILLGALGVLDDITTGQTAAVYEIFDAKPTLNFRELYSRAMRVGYEHIASLVNTLLLAYAGASLPLFLLLHDTTRTQPLWVVINSPEFAEEIVRTLVGSITLVIAVPVSTLLAAYYYSTYRERRARKRSLEKN